MVTREPTDATRESPSLEDVEARFRRWLDEVAGDAVAERLQAYVRTLSESVDRVAAVVAEEPEPHPEPAAEPDPAPEPAAGPAAPAGEPTGEDREADLQAALQAAEWRADFHDRFVAVLDPDLLTTADQVRGALFDRITALTEADPPLPDTLPALPGPGTREPPEALVRPTWGARLRSRWGRSGEGEIPVGLLSRLYAAEAARRLEPVLNDIARLQSLALEAIRGCLRAGPNGVAPTLPEGLHLQVDRIEDDLAAVLREVGDAFGRALHAPLVSVDADDAAESAARAVRGTARLRDGWRSFESALQANTRSEAVLDRALAHLRVAAAATVLDLERVAEAEGRAPLRRLAGGLRELAERAESQLPDPDGDVLRSLRSEAAALFDAEAKTFGHDLGSALYDQATALEERLAGIPPLVPDELLISEQRIQSIPERPRKLELRDAPVAELFQSACEGVLPRWIERELIEVAEELDVLDREMQRLQSAVDFHIRAPLRQGFAGGDVPGLVTGILHRSAGQLDDLRASTAQALDGIVAGLDAKVREEAETIAVTVAERGFLKIRSEIAEEQAVRQLSRGLRGSRRLADWALRMGRRGWATGRSGIRITRGWAQRQLGVDQVEREEMLESLEQSLIEDSRALPLPPLYRELFDVESEVPWEELLVARDAELATFRRAYERWARGQTATVTVIGEKGSGKTTFVRLTAAQVLGDTNIRTLVLDRTLDDESEFVAMLAEAFGVSATDPDDLAQAVRDLEPGVMIVEDAHHLFVRALDGFRVMETFLQVMGATRRSVLWVMTIDEYAWSYLDRAVGLAPHFTHQISTTNMASGALEEAVMARHEVSGYGLEFETTHAIREPSLLDRLLRRRPEGELSARELQRKVFFRDLDQIAEGNIFLALFYWLRSIDRVTDHALVMTDPEIIDLDFLDRLPLPALHTLAAIILHGGLSGREHQRIFQLTPAESRLQLASLAESHLIFRSDKDGEYKINKVLYRPFTRLLRSKNIF